jgi:ABC-type Mn2+/Zn2+ transport system permease subunit/Mn-dependent DtxR family transcriptional regulator
MSDGWESAAAWHANHAHVARALLAGSLVSIVCGVMGCFIVLRRMAFLGDALAHAMLAGVVAGYLIMKWLFGLEAHAPAMLLGALLAGLATVGLVGLVSRQSRVKEDAAIGIMYTGIFALGGLIASLFSHYIHIDLLHFVTGNLLAVELADLWMMAGVAAAVLTAVILGFRSLQLTSFDPVMAASLGVPVVALDYLLTTCTSLVVVSGVHIVGVILVVGLLITPAATALLLCRRLSVMLWVSAFFGLASFLEGYAISEWLNVAPGSAIVVAGTLQFAAVWAVAPEHGLVARWLARRRAVPQTVREDILGCVQRDGRDWVPWKVLSERLDGGTNRLRRAAEALAASHLVECSRDGLRLTDLGRDEALRLRRAHRLWETYLERLGTPASDLHRRADQLEHVNDERAVDYLDDKLGHPLVDPHGAEIPVDGKRIVAGALVRVSVLREGHQAVVRRIGPAASGLPLSVGQRIRVGPRRPDHTTWTIDLADGTVAALDHRQADDVLVELSDG